MQNIQEKSLLIEQISKENVALLEKQTQAINDLVGEFEMMFAIVKSELSKNCSLKTMRYMLMIDVFLNELKRVIFNYEEEYEEE